MVIISLRNILFNLIFGFEAYQNLVIGQAVEFGL